MVFLRYLPMLFLLFSECISFNLASNDNFHKTDKANHENIGRKGKNVALSTVLIPYSSNHHPIHQAYQAQYHYQYFHYYHHPLVLQSIPYHYPRYSTNPPVQQQQIPSLVQSQYHQPYHPQQSLETETTQNVQGYVYNQSNNETSLSAMPSSSTTFMPTNTPPSTTKLPYISYNRDIPPVISIHSALESVESRQMEESLVIPQPLQNDKASVRQVSINTPFSAKIPTSCKSKSNQWGSCKLFSECFPMFEIEYGRENRNQTKQRSNNDNDQLQYYIDSPLAEELLASTNSTICEQRNSDNHAIQRQICCPSFDFTYKREVHRVERYKNGFKSYYGGDRHVIFPSITQRPPLKSVVVTKEYIQKQMCGQPQIIRNKNPVKFIKKSDIVAMSKITGGVEASGPTEFPWMVAVFGKNKKIFCGASLITDIFLLSAAHCFSTFAPNDIKSLYVHLGDFNLRTTLDGLHEVRRIEKVIIHKGFNIQTYINDIALLKLDRPVNFSDRVHPICLPEPTTDLMEKKNVVVAGWGRKFRYGVTSDTLRKVEMPVWNYTECKRVYDTFAPGRLNLNNICAGDGKRNKDACLVNMTHCVSNPTPKKKKPRRISRNFCTVCSI